MFANQLVERTSAFCQLSQAQLALLEEHYRLLVRWNQVLNLTAVRDEEGMVERHYAESLFLGAHLPPGSGSVADLGSGAGFPGVPVSILHPEFQETLIESHQRKAVFLREVSRVIRNTHVESKRAEDVSGMFDWAICRAVKYSYISSSLKRLGMCVALLTGTMDPRELAGFEWPDPVRLPWGEHRYLWLGRNLSA